MTRASRGGLDRFRIVAVVVGAVTAVFALVPGAHAVFDPDVWWLALAGRDTIAQGSVPIVNGYSFTAPAHPWVMHEWLFGVLYAAAAKAGGPASFGLLAIAIGGAALAMVFRETLAARSTLLALGASLAVVLLFGVRLFSPRPSGMAIVFALLVAGLAFRERFETVHAALAVAIELVWTNAHGSFPLGVAILSIAAVTEPGGRRARAVAAGAALLVTILNPYGLHLHALVLGYVRGSDDGYAVIHRHVQEFLPLWRKADHADRWIDALRLALVTGMGLSALRDRRFRGRALLCLGLVPLAVVATRHIELCGLLGCMLLVSHVDDVITARLGPPASSETSVGARVALALLPAMALAIAANVNARATRSQLEWIDPGLGGPAIARLVASLPPGAAVYAPFRSAGLVLWLGAGRLRVFYDSRNDCYPRDVAEQFFRLDFQPDASASAALVERGTTAVVVPASHPLMAFLAESQRWESVRDSDWVLWRLRAE